MSEKSDKPIDAARDFLENKRFREESHEKTKQAI